MFEWHSNTASFHDETAIDNSNTRLVQYSGNCNRQLGAGFKLGVEVYGFQRPGGQPKEDSLPDSQWQKSRPEHLG